MLSKLSVDWIVYCPLRSCNSDMSDHQSMHLRGLFVEIQRSQWRRPSFNLHMLPGVFLAMHVTVYPNMHLASPLSLIHISCTHPRHRTLPVRAFVCDYTRGQRGFWQAE